MIAATLFDHPGYILLVVFVALVRWLASKAKQPQTPQSPPPPPPSRPISRGGETQTEEERVRRFLEALGQPPGTTPPKVPPRRREVQPKIYPPLPPLKTKPPPLPEVASAPPPLPTKTASVLPMPAREARFEVHDVARQASTERPPEIRPAGSLLLNLGTPRDLRTAIVLREIFGPPRSLQPLDQLSAI